MQLLGGKLSAVQTKWGNTFNLPGDAQGPGGQPIISPASQQIMQKLGGEGQSNGQQQNGNNNQQDYSSLWS